MGARLRWAPGFMARRRQNFEQAQTGLDSRVMTVMEPYMQRLTGAMIASMGRSTVPGGGKIRVTVPYARRAHDARTPVGRRGGALRGPRYFARMKADRAGTLLDYVKGLLGVR